MKRGFFGSSAPSEDASSREQFYGSSPARVKEPTSEGQPPKLPKRLLHPYESFVKNWLPYQERVPRGMQNCGNTCFAASSLQCLGAAPPLARYFMALDHECGKQGCLVCIFKEHVRERYEPGRKVDLSNIVHYIKRIAKHFVMYRQEDAHDFVQNLLDKLHESLLELIPPPPGEKKFDPTTQETTMIYHIFGGRTRSQVWCHQCGSVSNSYESFLTLSLEVTGKISSLADALHANFASKDELFGPNAYRCDTCKALTSATRTMRVHTPPNVLVIALKRYTTGLFGKINKKVTYDADMDLGEYMCGRTAGGAGGGGSHRYRLFGVIVHLDWALSTASGHYVCFVRVGDRWYKCDDSYVSEADEAAALGQAAYMLFYSREKPREAPETEEDAEEGEVEGRRGRAYEAAAAKGYPEGGGRYANGAGSRGRYGYGEQEDDRRREAAAAAAAAEQMRLHASHQPQAGYNGAAGPLSGRAVNGYGHAHAEGYGGEGHYAQQQSAPSPPSVRPPAPRKPSASDDSGTTIIRQGVPVRPAAAAAAAAIPEDDPDADDASSRARRSPPRAVEPKYNEHIDDDLQIVQVYLPGLTSADLEMETVGTPPEQQYMVLCAPGYRLQLPIHGTVQSAKFAQSKHILTVKVLLAPPAEAPRPRAAAPAPASRAAAAAAPAAHGGASYDAPPPAREREHPRHSGGYGGSSSGYAAGEREREYEPQSRFQQAQQQQQQQPYGGYAHRGAPAPEGGYDDGRFGNGGGGGGGEDDAPRYAGHAAYRDPAQVSTAHDAIARARMIAGVRDVPKAERVSAEYPPAAADHRQVMQHHRQMLGKEESYYD